MDGLCADARCCSSAHLLITRPPLALEGPRRRRPHPPRSHAHLPSLIIPGDNSSSSGSNKKKKAGLAVSVSVAGQWQRLA
ncbi:hypothetical protein CCHR01_10226 [Colletotrichum chrysophilum]|uniref:Uncharacterized protein n=1 Tax=Colletotrichum chrysophilum TaxID=1836956 RepID=A0AAD9AHP8_9PEZI|nr:hypothetical protein CCHR01_10226 [Colletotrichum chrysophilum]